ncbi:VCBS repeat-containing protein [Tissierella sp. MSJ-40]|uniref:VCBS repeat-containing protein n=1 Tax=Tissierella simiarum TaxID=2841534 RepID=A0ABS6E2G8_9FIRM|nr:VCBS repeat-containing protein [Tissierella simiarum]MBU5436984.1 VCBS repeat-containing protein [Tissierella simiarum]
MKKLVLVLTIALVLVTANIYAINGTSYKEEIDLLIIYDDSSDGYLDIYHNYNQSLIANLNKEAISLKNLNQIDINKFNAIYLDPNIIGKDLFNLSKDNIMEYVKKGGHLFLEDSFYNEFPLDFIGAENFEEINGFPKELQFPEVRENLKGLQNIVKMFHKDVANFYDEKTRESLNMGHGFYPTTATSLVRKGSLTLFGVNKVGEGSVFYANSLLPNNNYITGFDMTAKNENQQFFSFTFATGNYLMRNEFISYVSKELYGYTAKKVLGTYGRPAMAWQNHFEVASAVKDGSMERWIDVLKEYDEIPSYSLARSLYEWGDWKESIVYHKNIGDNTSFKFVGEEENSHYSSGEHLMTSKDYVSLNKYPEYKSLSAKIDLPYRAYLTLGDLNKNGTLDIVTGSSDGYIYLFLGKDEGTLYEDKVKLMDDKGNPLHVGSYSAPVLYDINKNGLLDLIVGNGEGKVTLYMNIGDMTFRKVSDLIEDKNLKNATPAIGDIDGDGTPDLIVGESKGNLYFYKGKWVNNTLTFDKKGTPLKDGKGNINVGTYPAPTIYDVDGDGKLELIVGNSTGYLRVYEVNYLNLTDNGFIEGETLNLYGNKRLWGGYYSVPAFGDLNKDGMVDLIVGQVEFGLPMPIDTDLFPYKEELKKALGYASEHHIEIYPHTYFHKYKKPAQEMKELELHKEAFKYYDIPWNKLGVNQHTWNINNISPTQTFYSEQKEGISWNSGFRPSGKAGEPSLSKDYIWAMPFRLEKGYETKDFILFTPAPHMPILEKAYDSITALDMPISYFYHMEYAVNTPKGLEDLRYKAEALNKMRNEKDYNFMMEPQMFKAFEANMKSKVKVLKNTVSNNYSYTFEVDNQNLKDNDYANTIGISFELGESLLSYDFQTDADIYQRKDKNLYIGLNKKVNVTLSSGKDNPHIVRVNGPVEIGKERDSMKINLNYAGLQQLKVYAPGGIEVKNKDFKVVNEGDYFVLTRYGDKTILEIKLY